MTLGQKLKILRKEQDLSQEALAEQLNVSRQAVSKWESDRGIPETETLLLISNMYHISIDYLLKDEYSEQPRQLNGYFVNSSMINDFLSYKRKRAIRLSLALSFIILSNFFVTLPYFKGMGMILYWIIMASGITLFVWHIFQPKCYTEFYSKQLLFNENELKDFREAYLKNHKKYVVMIIIGVLLLVLSPQVYLFHPDLIDYDLFTSLYFIPDTVSIVMFIMAGTSMHAENTIAKNQEYWQKRKSSGSYTWLYASLPITAAAVIIGFITNAWSPVFPVIALFCILLFTLCKLLVEKKVKAPEKE